MSKLRLRYQTLEFGDVDIHLRTLRDRQQYRDVDGVAEKLGIHSSNWALFGIVWASSEVLAHLMADYDVDGKRVLEVGCGIGLSSLLLNSRHADITATDYHPEAGAFLAENVRLNGGDCIPFVRTGWGDDDCGLGTFDIIIGSDLLYEAGHVELLSGFIDVHAKPTCDVILVDPGRGHHARFSKKMVSLGYRHSQRVPTDVGYLDKPYKGQILSYRRKAQALPSA
ncbi:methyltransferase type 12 [Marinobacterium nitratireducens]|uniref:Methyltransferase type 12 n=1 Tax=Marinobacterium nitratireducens TaxID=518897 RepID=A0A917ZNN3_9GAMM|nr:methyltransferase [Marinobacterium nitratireducens]GGO87043.1 methyltransferase type 12 [Marinobacterium nitratireducens]